MKPYEWKCPKCGAGFIVENDPFGGLQCEDQGKTHQHGDTDDPMESVPCDNACCYTCGWRGSMPPKEERRELEMTVTEFLMRKLAAWLDTQIARRFPR